MKPQNFPLEELFWFQEGPGVRKWQFMNSGVKLLNVGNIRSSGVLDLSRTERCISHDEVATRYKHFLVDEGDLVIASSGISFDDDGMLRTRGAFVERAHLPLCLNTSTIRFKSKRGASIRYLRFWLDSHQFRLQITRLVTGSAQQNFGPSHLKDVIISLPDFPKQQRIVRLLEHADELRRTRRFALEMSESFLPAAFLTTFGDLEKNPHCWPERELGELCAEVLDCPHSTPIYSAIRTPHPCIRSSDIQAGYLDFSESKYVEPSVFQNRIARGRPMPGDVIYCREGARFGNAARVLGNTEMCLGQRTMLFRANRNVAAGEFIWAFLSSRGGYRQATRALDGSASPHVNVGEIVAFRVPIPPLPLQQKFATVVERVDRLRLMHRESLRQAEHLFASLLKRAFSLV